MTLGQKAKLGPPLTQSKTCCAAVGQGSLTLQRLVASVERVIPGVNKGHQSTPPVRGGNGQKATGNAGQGDHDGQSAARYPGHPQN